MFKARLFVANSSAEGWRTKSEALKRGIVEPGHRFEGVRLPRECEKLTNDDLSVSIEQLDRIARRTDAQKMVSSSTKSG